FDIHLHTLVNLIEDLGQLILRQREDYGDWLNLGDDHEAVGIGGVNDVAGINKAQTDSTGDRRSDTRVNQLQLGVVNLALIGFDCAIELTDGRGLCVELLLRDDAFLKKQFVALQVDFRVFALRLIFRKLSFSLLQLNLKRAWIDFRKKITGLYVLPLLEGD